MRTRWKHELRSAADRAASLFGILERRERESAAGLTILTYHRVLDAERCADYPFPSLAMPLDAFREQVRWLAPRREVLPLAHALERLRAQKPSPRPLVALTFDDGYSDSSENAAAVLEDAGLRATFFVTTGFIGAREPMWFDRAALLFAEVPERVRREIVLDVCGSGKSDALPSSDAPPSAWTALLKRCRPHERRSILAALESAAGGPVAFDGYRAMSVADLQGLHARGHEIGSHSVTHPLMPELDERSLRMEVDGARDALAGWLGTVVPGFCYPNGDCDARVVAAVSRAGHRYACTTRDGIHRAGDDPFRIRRVDVVPDRALDGTRRFSATALRREMCGLYRRRGGASAAGTQAVAG